ncbi:hypothetical protein P8C59_008428 [Phyllachora maydis]|uniref:Uncharacterized protein n=1 Tax=Phyllachora maydis TaxID=1825666 RepID=A0AAD9MGU6_9PEZI|nr:hypothetical protein P8C59_008428 [Phyllachora maydis]
MQLKSLFVPLRRCHTSHRYASLGLPTLLDAAGQIGKYGLLAQDDRAAVVNRQTAQSPGRVLFRELRDGTVADVALLLCIDGVLESGLERVVLRRDIGAVRPESRFQPQSAESGPARGDDAVPLSGLPKSIPQAQAVLGTRMPAMMADFTREGGMSWRLSELIPLITSAARGPQSPMPPDPPVMSRT